MPPPDPAQPAPVVLYVEDDPSLEPWTDYLRAHYGRGSEGVRSYIAARRKLSQGNFRPDFVIHDCRPLHDDHDQVESQEAGNLLYAFLVDEGLPVVVISASTEEVMMQQEPYRSNPPLGWLSKPTDERIIHEAVELYRRWKEGNIK